MRQTFWVVATGLLTAATACTELPEGGGDDSAGSGADDTGGGAGGGTGGATGGGAGGGSGGGTGGGGSSDDAPIVLDGDAWCYQHATGDERWIWVAKATVTDPQGLDTIESMAPDGVVAMRGDTVIDSFTLVCADGECSATFDAGDTLSCSSATSFTFLLKAVDEDENWSEPYEVQGRQGTSAEG